ncbi:hypothetical protein [Methanosarcina sp. KYL-1]|uniref:hypothetical protein n=1 Tax=Methanosarcina sp. KYL-1 TaxID=2602068 RepID=UPI002100F618|nr:hypothetical protein [Methanosarcina sp. KYL-1]
MAFFKKPHLLQMNLLPEPLLIDELVTETPPFADELVTETPAFSSRDLSRRREGNLKLPEVVIAYDTD